MPLKKIGITFLFLSMPLFILAAFLPDTATTTPNSVQAQADTCVAQLETSVALSIVSCGTAARDTVCWGSGTMDYAPKEIEISQLGDKLPLGLTNSIVAFSSPDNTNRSIVRVNFPDPFSNGGHTTGFLFGPMEMLSDADVATRWSTFTLNPIEVGESSACQNTPSPGLLLQAPNNQFLILTINGTKISASHTVYVSLKTISVNGEGVTQTVISVLRGFATAERDGQVQIALAGESFQVVDNVELKPAIPLDYELVKNIPTQMLPRLVTIPLPGHVSVVQSSVLYLAPNAESQSNMTFNVGTQLNLLGQDVTGEWWHVIREDGVSGWIPSAAISGTFPFAAIVPRYEATPQPPTRLYGGIWGRGRTNSNYVNLRPIPSPDSDVLAQLIPGTEFGILGRSATGEWLQVQLDTPAPNTTITEGWLATSVVIVPNGFSVAELPIVPNQ